MGNHLHIVNPLHRKTARNYLGRMQNNKVDCMIKANAFGYDYWDGDRAYGYGGYHDDGRWAEPAARLIDNYGLKPGDSVLDVGCGKGFLLYEIGHRLAPCKTVGYDISEYALINAKEEIRESLRLQRAETAYPLENKSIDLAYSITTLHNLKLPDLKNALGELSRVGKNQFIVVESYRNEAELFNLECWALTCECFFRPEEWEFIFKEFGYSGDYEFIFFE